MKKLTQIKRVLAYNKSTLKKQYHVKKIGIFGSYARGEEKKSSDLDLLVTFTPGASLFDLVGLGNYLEEELEMKVDVVSEKGLRPEIKTTILKDVI